MFRVQSKFLFLLASGGGSTEVVGSALKLVDPGSSLVALGQMLMKSIFTATDWKRLIDVTTIIESISNWLASCLGCSWCN